MSASEPFAEMPAEVPCDKTDKELDHRVRLYDIALSVSDDFAYLFDLEGRFTFANRKLLEVWGKSLSEVVGKTCLELGYPAWHAEMHMREIRHVLSTKQPIKGEVAYTSPTGVFGIYEYIFKPAFGPDGEVEAVAGTTRDVTDRKRVEEILERQNQVLQLLTEDKPLTEILTALLELVEHESGPEVYGSILLLDDDGILHHAAAPSLPPSYTGAISGIAAGPHVGSCGRSAWLGEKVYVEDIARSELWADFRELALSHNLRACLSSPILSSSGKVLGIFSVYHSQPRKIQPGDTRIIETATRTAAIAIERKRIEEALRKSRDDAEAANRAKDHFLAVLSHELRTPLTPVLMAVASHQLDPRIPPPLREDLAMMKRNLELETTLIDDMLDLTRVMSGKLQLRLESLDVNALVSEACKISQPQIVEKAIQLECDLDVRHPHIMADSARFHQVLWNVLKNAAKFTPYGGKIRISAAAADGKVEIRVRDSGAGIRPEFLTRIFDAFEQGSSKAGGLGLGLAISKALIKLHAGDIFAESDGPGSGSTFVITVPTAEPGGTATDMSTEKTSLARTGPARILLVEDHADTAKILSRVLGASGYEVRHAATLAEARRVSDTEPFDLLVSDVGLPDGTGYQLMAELRPKGLLGIAMSGYGMDEDKGRSREAGFSDHLVKPVDLATLRRTLERLLQEKT
jgi:PAS domain S-box-containing protein